MRTNGDVDDDRTHASFFSGVGGLDMGLERAGWRTVSFSEIDPYASAVLAQRWSGVPNLGDITTLQAPLLGDMGTGLESVRDVRPDRGRPETLPAPERTSDDGKLGTDLAHGDQSDGRRQISSDGPDWPYAALWTGGFPCQDLSVAGKRRGMGAGTRSGLAYSFLALAERYRPRFVLLENVPGLLSSHGGRDMAALIGALVELGYGVGYRVLDARHFGVPQRRRRVFILGVSPGGRAGAERAAEVLSVGSRCRRHPPTGVEAGPGTAAGAPVSAEWPQRAAWTLKTTDEHGAGSPERSDLNLVPVSSSPDPGRVRAPDGLAGRSHDRGGVADTFRVGGRASGAGDSYDNTPWVAETVRSHPRPGSNSNGSLTIGGQPAPSDGLPLGLDSHRYRCCGNGVVSDVAEWIGLRLAALDHENERRRGR